MRSATMVATVTESGAASVTVDYELVTEAAWAPVSLLGFGSATAEVVLSDTDPSTPVPLEPESGSLRSARLGLSDGPVPGTRLLRVRYEVERAVAEGGPGLVARIPVLVVRWPSEQGGGELFQASVRLPAGWTVTEGFPTGLRAGVDGAYEARLPVVPSVIGARAGTGGSRRPGLPLLLDMAATLVLLAFGLVGWRHLSRLSS